MSAPSGNWQNWSNEIGNFLIKKVTFEADIPTFFCKKCHGRIGSSPPDQKWQCGKVDYESGTECPSCEWFQGIDPIRETYFNDSDYVKLWQELSKPRQAEEKKKNCNTIHNSKHSKTNESKIHGQ